MPSPLSNLHERHKPLGSWSFVCPMDDDLAAPAWIADDGQRLSIVRSYRVRGIRVLERVKREAAAAGRIKHNAILTVRETFDLEGGALAVVSRYEEGALLAQLLAAANRSLKSAPLPVAAAIALDLLDALDGLGGRAAPAWSHGTVRPETVLISGAGRAMLTDCGVGGVLGTEDPFATDPRWSAYASPEQIAGERPGVASDLFSIAALMCELMTSRALFAGRTHAEVKHKILEEPIALRAVQEKAGLAASVVGVLEGALERTSSDRFGTPKEMAEAVRAVCSPIAPRYEVADYLHRVQEIAIAQRRKVIERVTGRPPPIVEPQRPRTKGAAGRMSVPPGAPIPGRASVPPGKGTAAARTNSARPAGATASSAPVSGPSSRAPAARGPGAGASKAGRSSAGALGNGGVPGIRPSLAPPRPVGPSSPSATEGPASNNGAEPAHAPVVKADESEAQPTRAAEARAEPEQAARKAEEAKAAAEAAVVKAEAEAAAARAAAEAAMAKAEAEAAAAKAAADAAAAKEAAEAAARDAARKAEQARLEAEAERTRAEEAKAAAEAERAWAAAKAEEARIAAEAERAKAAAEEEEARAAAAEAANEAASSSDAEAEHAREPAEPGHAAEVEAPGSGARPDAGAAVSVRAPDGQRGGDESRDSEDVEPASGVDVPVDVDAEPSAASTSPAVAPVARSSPEAPAAPLGSLEDEPSFSGLSMKPPRRWPLVLIGMVVGSFLTFLLVRYVPGLAPGGQTPPTAAPTTSAAPIAPAPTTEPAAPAETATESSSDAAASSEPTSEPEPEPTRAPTPRVRPPTPTGPETPAPPQTTAPAAKPPPTTPAPTAAPAKPPPPTDVYD